MSQPGDARTVVGPGADAVWRRLRWPLLVLLVVLAASALAGLAGSGSTHGTLDPAAADPTGSRALATLLSDQGIRVVRATSVAAATARADGSGALVVPFPGRVPADQLDTLANAYAGDRLVLIGPGRDTLDALEARAVPHGTAPVARRDPDCDLPAAGTAGDADLGGRVYDPAGGTGCYPAAGGSTLVVTEDAGGGSLVVLGAGDLMENRRLDRRGNAALSLLLLGADGPATGSTGPTGSTGSTGPTGQVRQVVWLVSGPGSAASGSPSLVDIAPRWLVLGAVQLLLASLVVAVWRGRRLGSPVTEPLPVLVRAAETVEGRARLYRRAGARDHAAEALRAGALARLVPRLGLGVEPTAVAVIAAVSARAGTGGTGGTAGRDVGELLFGPPPVDDAGLVRLADRLDAVVATTLATPVPVVSPGRTGAPAEPHGSSAHPDGNVEEGGH